MAIKGLLRINNEFNLVILKFEALQGFFLATNFNEISLYNWFSIRYIDLNLITYSFIYIYISEFT